MSPVHLSVRQATSQDTNDDMDEEESEYDIMMVENAGEVIPSVAKLVSPQEFCSYLVGLLPELLRRTVSQFTLAQCQSIYTRTVSVNSHSVWIIFVMHALDLLTT